MGFLFCPHCRAGYFFFLDKKGSKKSRRQRSFGAQASTRLGVLVGPALLPGLLRVRGD
jgi:hypothetical protein